MKSVRVLDKITQLIDLGGGQKLVRSVYPLIAKTKERAEKRSRDVELWRRNP